MLHPPDSCLMSAWYISYTIRSALCLYTWLAMWCRTIMTESHMYCTINSKDINGAGSFCFIFQCNMWQTIDAGPMLAGDDLLRLPHQHIFGWRIRPLSPRRAVIHQIHVVSRPCTLPCLILILIRKKSPCAVNESYFLHKTTITSLAVPPPVKWANFLDPL